MSFSLTDTASVSADNSGSRSDSGERETYKLMTLEYSMKESGSIIEEPIVHLYCRDETGERHQIDVTGFYPHFLVSEEEFIMQKENLLSDIRVRYIEASDELLNARDMMNASIRGVGPAPKQSLHGDDLVKIYTVEPSDVADLRDMFDTTYEADVFFTNRFLIDTGIRTGFTAPSGADTVSIEEIESVSSDSDSDTTVPDVDPRACTVDIEVWSGGQFPDTDDPKKPVTAITAHDSYTGEMFSGVLHPDSVVEGDGHSWDDETCSLIRDEDVTVFDSESGLLGGFFEFVDETSPDLLTGWNSSGNGMGSGFDYPYLVNRAERINQWNYELLSAQDEGGVYTVSSGDANAVGRVMFDMLQAYKKTQIHKKRSYSLGYIAEDELGYGKEDIEDLDEGWKHDPVDFMTYNKRDVSAVHEIESEKSVLDIYDHIRSIAGATYSEIADSNIGIIDMLFLRRARESGYALPTSERPDTQHYWGGYVFDPVPGKHENVVYPDLSSLYPNLFRDMNASPETIVGDESDLEESQYSIEQCYSVYVDPRDEMVKKDADEPVREELYVLKPDVKESFVREIVQELIDMKYEYKKPEYASEAYGAVKRVVNSVYGVMGDGVSYGTGFRLFDWRIAEAITLAGRDVIKHTASEFENRVQSMGYNNASIIAGDTDSCVCSIPGADGTYNKSYLTRSQARDRIEESEILDESEVCVDSQLHETLLAAIDAAEYVDMTYDEFMTNRFGIEDDNMSVEIESYSEAAFFRDKKKRYGQWIRWDEGDYVDETEYKGFELVRSDSSRITGEVQTKVIDKILKNSSPKSVVSSYLEDEWNAVMNGDIDHERLGKPSAINNPLFDYGWSVDDDTGKVKYFTPQPHIRGARYAKNNIDGEDPSTGSKPLFFYTKGITPTSDLPETYSYEDVYSLNAPESKEDANRREMKEIDREVDAVSVEDVRNLPEAVHIDYEKMGRKAIRDPIEPIIEDMGWSFDNIIEEGDQSGLAQFM